MNKQHIGFGLALVVGSLIAPPLGARSLAQNAVNKANEVIDAALEAYGGAAALNQLNSVIRESDFTNYAVNQSRKPGPPWDKNTSNNINAIDFERQVFAVRNQGSGSGFVFNNGTIINGEESYQLNFRAATAAPIAQPDFDTASGPFIRVTPTLLIKQLQQRRQTSHWLGVETVDGRPHDVVTLVMEVGPALSLYIDQETHLLSKSERILPPFGTVEYRFYDYQKIAGIPFNQRFVLLVNGDTNIEIDVRSTRVNESVDSFLEAPASLARVEAIQPDNLGLQTLDQGVYLVGGNGTYVLFVEMSDYVIAIGGTAGIPARIEELRKVVADKPIRYGVLTHHHNDHLLGVAPYVAEEATILTVAEHEAIVRATAATDDIKLQLVDGHHVFNDGQRRVEIHDIGPTPHTEHLLVAYLPAEGIVFEADHFPQPQTGPLPPANPVTVAFGRAVKDKGFRIKKIVGAHSPRASSADDLAAVISGH